MLTINLKAMAQQQSKDEKKGQMAYWLAWLAIVVSTISAISNHLHTIEIPKKDDYKG